MKSAFYAALGAASVAALALVAAAGPASALNTFDVTDVSYSNLLNIDLGGQLPGGPYISPYEQAGGPIFLTGKVNGVGKTETLLVYCDDIPHHISGGAQNIVFDIVPLSQNNAGGNPASNTQLTAQQIQNLSGLSSLGYRDYLKGDITDANVIQGAIWIEEYAPGLNGDSYDSYGPTQDAYLNGRLNYFLGLNFGPSTDKTVQLLNLSNGVIDIQGQIPGGVPEPAAWTMMLLGFGALGASLRRRRALAAA